jgi:ribonuclease HII
MVSANEIESNGIVAALRAAGSAAISSLLDDVRANSQAATLVNDGCLILLDGSHNWLGASTAGFTVVTQTKADRDCVSVAAASVIAKVARDRVMIELDGALPGYGFAGNKGYSSAGHISALRQIGSISEHRTSWLAKILANDSDESNT